MKTIRFLYGLLPLLVACSSNESTPDAYGNFSAVEITVSAEVSGRILAKYFDEGEEVKEGVTVFQIDTVQSYLKQLEIEARRKSILAKRANVAAQVEVLEEQRRAIREDLVRFHDMLSDGAVSQKQVDDLENQLTVLEKQIAQVRTNYASLEAEASALKATARQAEDLISRASARAPVSGTLIELYADMGESVAIGKPLYKIADLHTLELKAYFTGNQLPLLKIGGEVIVQVDDGKGGLKEYKGKINWISPRAEFTPKILQTREERVSLVYAVKILVENDGALKINMPAEVCLLTKSVSE